jgi:hypothetical protein
MVILVVTKEKDVFLFVNFSTSTNVINLYVSELPTLYQKTV